MNPFALIVPAAGTGSRSGRSVPKQYVEIAGRPVLGWTLRAFLAIEECVEIVVAIDEACSDVALRCADDDPRVRFVAGGSERQHSIASALATLASDVRLVLVHDAARPCVDTRLVERVVEAAAAHGACIPALPVAETVKRVDADGRILETIPRGTLRLAQTPQAFERSLLEHAYRAARERGDLGTDDASLVEAIGATVWTVEGDVRNLKITGPEDFDRAERYLAAR